VGGALVHYQQALGLRPDYVEAQNNLAWVLATCPEASVRNGGQALVLAQQANQLSGGNHPIMLKTLAATYAEVGRFAEAVATAQQALALATAANNAALADDLRAQIGLYQAGSPFRDTGLTNTSASARPVE
jgi:tetratricopeptide (TPR) repeat protein